MADRLRQQYLAQSGDYQTLIAELPEIGGGVTMQAGNKAVTDAIVQGWPESQTWIQNLPAETRERFAEPVLAGLLATDPAAAAAFYSGLQSPGNAATAFKSNQGYPPRDIIERIASAWAMENAPAARQWVASLPDANQRAAAEKALQK